MTRPSAIWLKQINFRFFVAPLRYAPLRGQQAAARGGARRRVVELSMTAKGSRAAAVVVGAGVGQLRGAPHSGTDISAP